MALRAVAAWFVLGLCSAVLSAAEKKIDFNRDIKPILSNKCYFCHGPDEAERKGGTDGLRLDTVDAYLDLGGHAAIVPGDPAKSALLQRIATDDPDELMPPPKTGPRLTVKEVELLKEWIRQGAGYAPHWSYAQPIRPAVPAVKNTAWAKNDIDRFLLARMEREGLSPGSEADRFALIRRLSLDLTGLPPTVAEADAFAADADPQAYEKLVERLLQKEAFGEHWAHFWLDLVRYADSSGYADDPARTIWLYRDYVIKSLNANKPFDQFTIEQLAGDLLPQPTDDQLIATAFNRNTLTNNEGGTNDEEFRNVAVVDRVNTTMAVWMGTTIACAQCHTHKYDPLSQEEYFKLFAIFNSTEDADRGDESPLYSQMSEEQRKQQQGWKDELARVEATLKTSTPELKAAQAKWEQAFPRDLAWRPLRPTSFASQAGIAGKAADDGTITVAQGGETDTYTVEIPAAGKVRALRLETLPADDLPGKGAGFGGGNFVVTQIGAAVAPPAGVTQKARFLRVELPGAGRMLSLAEVQVFRGAQNVALTGEATQSSTDFDGPAKLAIDGNTNGHYTEAKSTTHTAVSYNPWWELDLKSEQPLDRIVVWNRTDGNVGSRLANFRLIVLDEKRNPVREETIAAAPSPSYELSLTGARGIDFTVAVADYAQPGFDAASLLDANEGKKKKGQKEKGWAVGGKITEPHVLTLVAAAPAELPEGSKLVVTIEQASKHAGHTLGRFRLSATDDAAAETYAKTPASVLEAVRLPAAERTAAQQEQLTTYFLAQAAELEPARKQAAELTKQLGSLKPTTVPIMREMKKARVTKLQHRGNYLDQGQEVHPGLPAVFHPPATEDAMDRLRLARWLIDENNPLTARVIANRYWEQLFGIGIVATSEEFGSQGDQPFHPELLDWLATELQRQKWDTKALIRLLVTSAAYRQSSKVTPELTQLDPENRFLARGPRFRMSAEMIRDQALAASGLLSSKMYGPPVKPPQPILGVSAAFGGGIDWTTSMGEDKYRRALYTTWRRSNPYPSMATFDAPNRETCTLRRTRTNTPLQALVTLNDPVYIEAAQALARQTIAAGGATPLEKLTYAFRRVLTRPPHANEADRLVALYTQSKERFAANPDQAKKLALEPLGALPAGMDVNEAAAWTVVSNVLLNLDETLMKR